MQTSIKTNLEIDKINAELEKLELEKEKIRLENKDLKKSFWKRPQWITPAVTLIVTVISALFLFVNGIFDNKYQQYKVEKATLEKEKIFLQSDIKKFQDQKISIESEINILKDSLNIKNSYLNQLEINKTELEKVINVLNNSIGNKNQEVYKIMSQKQKYEMLMRDSIVRMRKKIIDLEIRKIMGAE